MVYYFIFEIRKRRPNLPRSIVDWTKAGHRLTVMERKRKEVIDQEQRGSEQDRAESSIYSRKLAGSVCP